MSDSILRQLWLAAIIVRGFCLLVALWKRAPVWWSIWIGASEAFALRAHWIDSVHNGALYCDWWITEQIVCILIMAVYVWRDVRPPIALVILSTIFTDIVGSMIGLSDHWPASYLEPTMFWVGLAGLWLGIVAMVTAIALQQLRHWILAIYLVMYALMMIAGPDYLTQAGIGRAWSVMEILAIVAWGWVWIAEGNNNSCRPESLLR